MTGSRRRQGSTTITSLTLKGALNPKSSSPIGRIERRAEKQNQLVLVTCSTLFCDFETSTEYEALAEAELQFTIHTPPK